MVYPIGGAKIRTTTNGFVDTKYMFAPRPCVELGPYCRSKREVVVRDISFNIWRRKDVIVGVHDECLIVICQVLADKVKVDPQSLLDF